MSTKQQAADALARAVRELITSPMEAGHLILSDKALDQLKLCQKALDEYDAADSAGDITLEDVRKYHSKYDNESLSWILFKTALPGIVDGIQKERRAMARPIESFRGILDTKDNP